MPFFEDDIDGADWHDETIKNLEYQPLDIDTTREIVLSHYDPEDGVDRTDDNDDDFEND